MRQKNYQTARNYWKVLKNQLSKEGRQSVPSPKAEPITLWLVKVGYERMTGQETRNKLKGLKSQNLRDHMNEADAFADRIGRNVRKQSDGWQKVARHE